MTATRTPAAVMTVPQAIIASKYLRMAHAPCPRTRQYKTTALGCRVLASARAALARRPHLRRRGGHVHVISGAVRDRVRDCVHHRRDRRRGAGLARALDA